MKTYVKPELYYESFALSQHIAGCSLSLKVGSAATCNASGTIGSVTLEAAEGAKSGWFLSKTACAVTVEDYCYTNGAATLSTINS